MSSQPPDPPTSTPSPSAEPTPPAETCRCGHGRSHPMVSAEPEYGAGGWALVLFGVSARPVRVKYRCRRCTTVIGSTTDPAVLRSHV